MAMTLFQIEEIMARLSEGETLTRICRDAHLPSRQAVLAEVRSNENLSKRYARAMDDQADAWSDEIVEIADDWRSMPDANQRKLAVDTRKWVMSKKAPYKYSERHLLNHEHQGGIELHVIGSFPTTDQKESDDPE